jgi:Fe-S-cluster containining protein
MTENNQESSKIILSEETKSKLCLLCLGCCKDIIITTVHRYNDSNILQAMELYHTRNIYSIGFQNGYLVLKADIPCRHLTPEGCSIYKSRPEACKVFDGSKSQYLEDICLWHESVRRAKNISLDK